METLVKVYQNFKTFLQKFYDPIPQTTYIEFSEFFRSEKLLNFSGFYSSFQDVSQKGSKWRRIFFTVSMINTILSFVLVVISIVIGSIQGESFLILTENLGLNSILALVLIKVFTIVYWHREMIEKIVLKLSQHYPHDAWNQHIFCVSRHLKTLNIDATICGLMYSAVVIQYISLPLIMKLKGVTLSQGVRPDLIFQLQLPVDTTMPVMYTILFINGSWTIMFSSLTVIMTDLVFAEIVAVINMEFMILGRLISEIDPLDGQNEAIEELMKLSGIHQELIVSSENLRDMFSPILFIDCFGMMITMCCSAFFTLSGIGPYFMFKFTLILACTAWNSFIHCFYGNRLNEASLSVADGAYNSNWLSGNIKFRKMILIVMVRAQKVQELTGMEFLNINLETYKWIIDAAYTYFSVLSAVYKP